MSHSRQRYSQALDHFGSGQLEEASRLIEELLKEDPLFLDAYEGLAMAYSRQGRVDDAIEVMHRLLSKDPKSVMAHSNLSVFYLKKGMKDKAEEEKAKATVLQFENLSKPKPPS